MADRDVSSPPRSEDQGSGGQRQMFDRISKLFSVGAVSGGLVTVAVALLIFQNGASARLSWLTLDFDAPLWIILVLTLVAGAVVWELGKALWRRRRRRDR